MKTRRKDKAKVAKKYLFIIMSCIALFGFIIFIGCIVLTPKLYLTGKDISIEVGSRYIESGYKAYVLNKDISDRVQISGNIDTNKIGIYHIEYEVRFFIFDVKKERKISVLDKMMPVLSLNGEEEVFLCPGKSYIEEGYKAVDVNDGNITKKVERIEGNSGIIYKVQDSFGNSVLKERKIIKKDIEDPVIQLYGFSNMTIHLGDKYNEPGYSAVDNCDGDISNRVIVTGNVNTNREGSYTLYYKVADIFGNESTVSRVIHVVDDVNTHSGVIYLIFQDGSSHRITGKILDVLKEEEVKATFLTTNKGNLLNSFIKREYHEGHTVGVDNYDKNYQSIYSSRNDNMNDFNKICLVLNNITDLDSKNLNFSKTNIHTNSRRYTVGVLSYFTRELTNKGYRYFDWNVTFKNIEDVGGVDVIYHNVIDNLRKNHFNIVLLDDFEDNYDTLNALKKIIQYGKNHGYTFSGIAMDVSK